MFSETEEREALEPKPGPPPFYKWWDREHPTDPQTDALNKCIQEAYTAKMRKLYEEKP